MFKLGQPKPEVSWSLEGKEIKDGGRFSITNTDSDYKLTIKETTEADSGTYR